MKKTFIAFITALICMCTFNSCTVSYAATDAAVQYDDIYYTYQVDYQTIVVRGVPVYNEDGTLAYYSYQNIYYYPYFWNNAWYFHPYRFIQPRGFVHRPHHGFRPDPRFRKPDNFNHNFTNKGNMINNMRPNIHNGKPEVRSGHDGQMERPNMNNRQFPNTRSGMNRGEIRTPNNSNSSSRPNMNSRPNFSTPQRNGSMGGGMTRGGNTGGIRSGMGHGGRR